MLKESLSLRSLVAISAGLALASSCFPLLATAAKQAGGEVVGLAVVAAGVISVFLSFCYAEMATLFDRARINETIQQLPCGAWLDVGADILVPAAVGGAINESVQEKVKAQMIVEGANMPLTRGVADVLSARGVCIIPDYIANAGAATVFGLLITGQAAISNVLEESCCRIRQAVRELLEYSRSKGCSTYVAAKALARQSA